MRRPLVLRVHRAAVADEAVAGHQFDYADAFEVQLPEPDPLAPREWLARGLTALLLRVRDEAGTSPDDLADWQVIESTSDVIHIERCLPLLHVVVVGRRLGSSGRRLTTLLRFQRPVLSRLLWTFVGVGHRLAVRRLLCHGATTAHAAGKPTVRPPDATPEPTTAASAPLTQAERRTRSRTAILESAARGLSRHGYGNLVLEDVARDAGYTRGALYHQFKDKNDLTLAVFAWVLDTWDREVGDLVDQQTDPRAALLTLARHHAIFCRRDVARVAVALRVECSGQDHPVGRQVEEAYELLVARCVQLIDGGRAASTIPAGPPSPAVALALVGAVEGTTIMLAGQTPHDEVLAERAAAGVLGLPPSASHADDARGPSA